MYLTRRRLVRKRSVYEFTLRCLHIYYRDWYNKLLPSVKYEENSIPNLIELEFGDQLTVGKQYIGAKENKIT